MKKFFAKLKEGLFFKNPVLVQLLGMCATLAISKTVLDSLAMGLSVTAVLICSNVLISLLRKVIPDQVRIAAFIVIIAGFVCIVEMVMKAYFFDSFYKTLGSFISLIVVNCIILARAEAFASKNGIGASALDGVVMGLGYTFAIVLLGAVREILSNGTFCGLRLIPEDYTIGLIGQPAGAFIMLGILIAAMNAILTASEKKAKKKEEEKK